MNRVTVTATLNERLAGQTASSITVLDAQTIRTSPSRAVDDLLRQVPGFSLLRRTSSVAAHPTSQGISLRGVGASGASRTLVMADRIPVNDPFGTWVYWNRVPKLSIDSIEVVRGGASDLYGSSALGGVIHLRTRRPTPATFLAEGAYGERNQGQGAIYASDVRGPWGYSVAAEAFGTDGYVAIAPAQRGPKDTEVAVDYRTAAFQLERRVGASGRVYSGFTYSDEDRKNGTPLLQNDTEFRQVVLGAEAPHRFGQSDFQIFGGSEGFDSSFTSVTGTAAAPRSIESLTFTQSVPLGFGGLQGHTLLTFGQHTFVTGLEYRKARGISNEDAYRSGAVFSRSRNGGTQQNFGVFLEDVITFNPQVSANWSIRWDRWKNESVTGEEAIESSWSPKFGASVRVHPNIIVRGAGYGAFRAPTLNELYRPFQVGNALTQANPRLGDERLQGVELGVETETLSGRLHARIGGFWSRLDGAVANITLQTTPTIIRQRRNLGKTRSRGLETEIEFRPFRLWTVTGGYLLTQSVVTSFPTQPTLVGRRIPQVPRHQYSFSIQGTFASNYHVNLQGRGAGLQFDDDINSFRLPRFFTLDAYASRSFGNMVEVFVAAENMTNAEVEVAKTPVTSLGMPRTVRVGMSMRLGDQ